MKLLRSAFLARDREMWNRETLRGEPTPRLGRALVALTLLTLALMLLASCSSLGKPERQPSPVAPACNQREPARDSAAPPEGDLAYDWMAWAQAYVASQWAIVDRDNKRAATADCLDEIARIKP